MTSKVYLARVADGAPAAEQAGALEKVLKAGGFLDRLQRLDMVAVKVHVGEKHNVTHVRPEVVARAVSLVRDAGGQPFLTETATLYRGERENAIKHALHAHAHGFGIEAVGAPFISADGLSGTDEAEVRVDGEFHRSVKVAGQILLADALMVISHPTGHMGSGLGAAIKNVGMGLASRAGKMRQHSSITPEVEPEKCENCGKCRQWCPVDAIDEREGVSCIRPQDCIGCGECIAVCRYGAVKFDYAIESPVLQKSMAEHAAGVLAHFGGRTVFINVLVGMTRECDCLNKRQEKAFADVGILACDDIVAADQATLDISAAAHGSDLAHQSFPKLDPTIQIRHAEKIGLGNRAYRLVEV